MSRARDLSRFANNQAISIDSSLNVGINSTSPDAKLDVVGVVSATEFYGDGSNLTGVSSPGLGTALSDDTTSPLNSIYFTNANLSVASTITVNPPSSASAAFTQYANIVLQNDADLIVADGDTFIPDILGIGTDVDEPGTLTGGAGKLRVDNITNKAGTGSPNFPFGMVIAGVVTATDGSFSGNVSVGGTLTYEDVTSIDSVGIITAQAGVNVTGGTVIVGADPNDGSSPGCKMTTTGVIQAARASGSAASAVFMGFLEGDTSANFRVNANGSGYLMGNVGIGTNNPTASLQINSATPKIILRDDDNGADISVASIGGAAVYSAASENIFQVASTTEALRITSAGNVGIGTDNPLRQLEVFNTGHATAAIKGDTQSSLFFVDSGDSNIGQISYVHTDNHMYFRVNDAERLRITSAGRIGLGRTDPSTQLDGNKHAQFAGVYNGVVENSVNNNSGLILLHKLGEGKGFYFAGDIIVMSWTGQAKIDCILSAKYNNDQLGWNVRDNGTGGTNMVSKTTVKFGTVTYDSGTWVCIKKDGGGSGVVQLNGFLSSNAKTHLLDGHQTLEITSGYSSFSNSATLN